jgi:hypothetical protein
MESLKYWLYFSVVRLTLSYVNPFTFLVIPGLTRNPVFLNWIPAGVYPVLDTGRE